MTNAAEGDLGNSVDTRIGAEEFRRMGYRMVDYVAEYISTLEGRRPVRSAVQPGYLRSLLPDAAPEQGEPLEAVLADVDRTIMPGITHWQHPAFFAYFSANTSPPAMLADMLCNALMPIGFSWVGSPAATELETICMDWLAKLLHLPPSFLSTNGPGGGVIQGTASEACLVTLLAAKARAMHGRPAEEVLRLVAYTSDQAHLMVKKGCMVAGIQHLRLVPTEVQHGHSMQAPALNQMIQEDMQSGLVPFFLCATIGTTSSCAVDDVADLASLAQQHSMWLHVDAAWAGVFSALPEMRDQGYFRGLDRADSFDTNPHKGLLTNFDCSALWVRDATWLKQALSLTPDYLKAQANTLDYKDWQVPLGRKFRALKLWFVLRMYGAEGLRAALRKRLYLQTLLEELVGGDHRFEIVAPPRFGLVCIALKGATTEESAALLEGVNASGDAFLTHTTLDGRHVIRMAIGGTYTQASHVRGAWAAIQREADAQGLAR